MGYGHLTHGKFMILCCKLDCQPGNKGGIQVTLLESVLEFSICRYNHLFGRQCRPETKETSEVLNSNLDFHSNQKKRTT
jgi:hypothetical protein